MRRQSLDNHVHVLQWLEANGVPRGRHGGNDLGHLALTAEANGRSAALQWVVANSDDWDRDECLAEAGTHEVRDWIEAFQPAGGDL
jgi:hypothetical protein